MNLARALQCIPQFSSVCIVDMCDTEELPPASRYHVLRDVLSSELAVSQRVRSARCHLFTANHLESFIGSALAHFLTGVTEPFSFIRASRDHLPIAPSMASHLKDFINILHSRGVRAPDVAAEVATRILLDSLPPGMHRAFLWSTIMLHANSSAQAFPLKISSVFSTGVSATKRAKTGRLFQMSSATL